MVLAAAPVAGGTLDLVAEPAWDVAERFVFENAAGATAMAEGHVAALLRGRAASRGLFAVVFTQT